MTISILGAFLGGVLTLLSPCSVMLLPAFFAYAFTSVRAIVARTGVFFLGLATTLVPLGILAGSLGQWLQQHRVAVVTVASIVVIVLGLVLLIGVPIPGIGRARGMSSASIASVYALGTVYGLAGVCAGPILGTVLTVAGLSSNPLSGGILMLALAAGMAAPLLLLALLWERVPAVKQAVRPREIVLGRWRNTWTQVIGGLLTVAVGVLLLVTEGTATLGGVFTVEQQFAVESSVLRFARQVPWWGTTLLALAVLALVWVVVWRRPSAQVADRTRESTKAQEPLTE